MKHCKPYANWVWVKNRYPEWNPGKWKQRLQPVVSWWSNFDPYPICTTNNPNRGKLITSFGYHKQPVAYEIGQQVRTRRPHLTPAPMHAGTWASSNRAPAAWRRKKTSGPCDRKPAPVQASRRHAKPGLSSHRILKTSVSNSESHQHSESKITGSLLVPQAGSSC